MAFHNISRYFSHAFPEQQNRRKGTECSYVGSSIISKEQENELTGLRSREQYIVTLPIHMVILP